MPGNSLVGIDIQGNLPAAFAGRQSSVTANVQANVSASFAVISYKGRNFHIKYRGEEELVADPMRPDVPSSYLSIIVIGGAAAISKQFFINKYTEGSDSAPDCYSLDGVKPDVGSPHKQANLCATCPRNQWGSRITNDGRRGRECQDSRRLAVVPAGDIQNEAFDGPMLLRVPPMSLNNLAMYGAALARRGVPIEAVVTRLSFDYSVAYPLLTFTPERMLSNEEAAIIVGSGVNDGMLEHPALQRILYDSIAEPGLGGGDQDEDQQRPTPEPAQTPEPAPAPQQAPSSEPAPAPQQVAQQPTAAVTPVTAAPAPTPTPVAAPAPAPRRRTAAFAGAVTAPALTAPATAAIAAAQVAQAPPNGAVAPVSVAPPNMQQAIDDLIAAPAALVH